MEDHRVIAIDLAKHIFQVCVLDGNNQQLCNKSLRRKPLAAFLAQQNPAVVALEACSGAHHWGRLAESFGHQVVIIPPKCVLAYRQGQKTDSNDVLAIGIAARQPRLKTVGVKTLEQQSVQSDKRVQEHLSGSIDGDGEHVEVAGGGVWDCDCKGGPGIEAGAAEDSGRWGQWFTAGDASEFESGVATMATAGGEFEAQ